MNAQKKARPKLVSKTARSRPRPRVVKSTAKSSSDANRKTAAARSYEAEKHLRKFCNVTSHELSNVLGAIVGELDYGLSSPSPDARNKAMTVALDAAERALTLARNLRYFAVHTRLDVHSTDVSQLLLDTVDLVEKELESHKIQLTVFVEAMTYAIVDPGAIQQVVLNLIANAKQAMPSGGKITLTMRALPKNLEISVSDTGVGIHPDHLDRVFEPYFIGGRKDGHHSQGLGLAVAKALVDAHGGELTVESRDGDGSIFTMLIPADNLLPKPSPYPEKRRHRRVRMSLPVEISFKGQPPLKTELSMLSVGGCFVHIPDPKSVRLPDLHGSVSLRIQYYNDQVLQVPQCRIASICRIDMNAGIGVEFLETDNKAKKVLAALVKGHSS